MAESKSLPQPLNQVAEFIGGLTVKQRLMMIGGAGLVALTLWGFVFLIGKPKYTTLYSGLHPSDAQALGVRLAAKNISYELNASAVQASKSMIQQAIEILR